MGISTRSLSPSLALCAWNTAHKACLSPFNCIATDFKHNTKHTHQRLPKYVYQKILLALDGRVLPEQNALKMLPGSKHSRPMDFYASFGELWLSILPKSMRGINHSQFHTFLMALTIGIVCCSHHVNNVEINKAQVWSRQMQCSIILYCFARKTINCDFHSHGKVKPIPI